MIREDLVAERIAVESYSVIRLLVGSLSPSCEFGVAAREHPFGAEIRLPIQMRDSLFDFVGVTPAPPRRGSGGER